MKALYKPFGLVFGILAGLVARRIFDFVWSRLDDEEAPKPTTRETPTGKIIAAAALQGAIQRSVKAVVTRGGARGFAHLTGVWPGEERPEPK